MDVGMGSDFVVAEVQVHLYAMYHKGSMINTVAGAIHRVFPLAISCCDRPLLYAENRAAGSAWTHRALAAELLDYSLGGRTSP